VKNFPVVGGILVRESCVEVVKIDFLKQKVEILVRESCVEVHKFARLLDPNTERAAPPLKGPPLFLKIHITITLRQEDKKFFFCQPR
jgi:hypothetical protein